jgi:hypothetical protein
MMRAGALRKGRGRVRARRASSTRREGTDWPRAKRRRALRPSTSGAGATRLTRRPLRRRPRRRSLRRVRRRGRIPRNRSASSGHTARSETPPSGAGEIAASQPPSRSLKASSSAVGLGGTSPPTRTALPPSAAALRATSSRRAPREGPRWIIQPGAGTPASDRSQARRSSAGVATTRRAPARRAARAHPLANSLKSPSAAGECSPFSRACRAGSRAKRTRKRFIVPILRPRPD